MNINKKLLLCRKLVDYKELHRANKGKPVLDIKTGKIYRSIADLSDVIGIPRYELNRRLSGKRKNNTSYRYL